MKMAVLIPWFLPNRGGAEIGAWELSRRLVRLGHEVVVITPRYRLDWPAEERLEGGLQIWRYLSLAPSAWKRIGEAAHCLQGLPGVFRLLNRFKPDLVHLHYLFFTGYPGMLWSRRNRRPTLLTLVGNDVYDPYYIPCSFLDPLNRWTIHQADRVVAASRFVQNVVSEKFGFPPDKMAIVPYGVDLTRFTPIADTSLRTLRDRLGITASGPVILTVQRLHERKGVHYYLEAAKRVLDRRPDAYFVVVGGGPERARLEALAHMLGIAKKVKFTGRVADEELPLYYQACDLFAFHTLHEGFGIVLLEAMATAKAVVTTRAGGTLDIVQDGENGRLVEPRDPTGFAEAVLELLQDPARTAEIGRRNRQRVEAHYNWDGLTQRYLALYKEILAPREAVLC